MKVFSAILFVALATNFVHGTELDPRIIGGEIAESGQFKFIASVRDAQSDEHYCGATILDKRHLVTAAHCKISTVDWVEVVVGSTKIDDENAKRYTVDTFVQHEDYDRKQLTFDAAVIRVTEDIDFNDLVQPIELTASALDYKQPLVLAGWGKNRYPGSISNDLKWLKTNPLTYDQCQELSNTNITGKICTLVALGQGACSGDSGGPLINKDNELVGIASSAYLCARGLPDFFTDVNFVKDWIIKHAYLMANNMTDIK